MITHDPLIQPWSKSVINPTDEVNQNPNITKSSKKEHLPMSKQYYLLLRFNQTISNKPNRTFQIIWWSVDLNICLDQVK